MAAVASVWPWRSIGSGDMPAAPTMLGAQWLETGVKAGGAEVIAERLRVAAGKAPVAVDAGEIAVTVSIGVASHASEEAADPGILLKRADLAKKQQAGVAQ